MSIAAGPTFVFDNSFARDLAGLYEPWGPDPVPAPRLLALNEALALEIGLDPQELTSQAGLAVLAGNAVPIDAAPLAQAYSGHQFGNLSPRLGDGRALLLGEVVDVFGRRRDIHLKGSGRTPFARGGDGKAAVGPMLREYVIGEAMHALGIPTTRALAVVATGEDIARETDAPGCGAHPRGVEPPARRHVPVRRAHRRPRTAAPAARPRHRAPPRWCGRGRRPGTRRCSTPSSRRRRPSSPGGCWSASSTG